MDFTSFKWSCRQRYPKTQNPLNYDSEILLGTSWPWVRDAFHVPEALRRDPLPRAVALTAAWRVDGLRLTWPPAGALPRTPLCAPALFRRLYCRWSQTLMRFINFGWTCRMWIQKLTSVDEHSRWAVFVYGAPHARPVTPSNHFPCVIAKLWCGQMPRAGITHHQHHKRRRARTPLLLQLSVGDSGAVSTQKLAEFHQGKGTSVQISLWHRI